MPDLKMILSTVYEYVYASQQALNMEWFLDRPLITIIILILPIVISLLMPATLLFQMYVSAWFLNFYQWYHKDKDQDSPQLWDRAKYWLSLAWDSFGKLYYGYEVYGLENIPKDGPALIIFYHGALPVDWYFLAARYYLYKKRMMGAVGDNLLFKVPGWTNLLKTFNIQPGTVESCSDFLKNGNILAISPGGVREAQFADENYQIMWGTRDGFAKVAMDAKVPIIPIFTQNIREAYSTVSLGRSWAREFYERTRIPISPLFGGLPVKLRTFIGKPIPYDSKETSKELSAMAKERMQELISMHQPLPGSFVRALLERIPNPKSF